MTSMTTKDTAMSEGRAPTRDELLHIVSGQAEVIDRLARQCEGIRKAAEIGLEWVIDAANERKQKDAVFDNAMRDIERIEQALAALPEEVGK